MRFGCAHQWQPEVPDTACTSCLLASTLRTTKGVSSNLIRVPSVSKLFDRPQCFDYLVGLLIVCQHNPSQDKQMLGRLWYSWPASAHQPELIKTKDDLMMFSGCNRRRTTTSRSSYIEFRALTAFRYEMPTWAVPNTRAIYTPVYLALKCL